MVAVPTGLTATPISESQIDLDWDDVLDATGYDVERNGVVIAQVGTSFFSDTGLAATTEYDYRVRAVDCNPPAELLDFTFIEGFAAGGSVVVDIGEEAPRRTVIVLGGRQSSGLITCLINGVPATVDFASVGVSRAVIAARAIVPEGSTVSIDCNSDGFGVWVSLDEAVLYDVEMSGWDHNVNATVATVDGGAVVSHAASDASLGSHVWTGVTERYDLLRSSGGDAAATGADVTVTHASWSTRIIVASYRLPELFPSSSLYPSASTYPGFH